MPRSRGASEGPQRSAARVPPHLRTSSSDSDPLHHRPITERSPKPLDRRSPRGTKSEPVTQKKFGTRIADLESQLGQAQEELKNLKEQLASAEAAKKEAQEQLEKKIEKPIVPEEEKPPKVTQEFNERDISPSNDVVGDNQQQETDVFEVLVEKMTVEPKLETSQLTEEEVQKDSKLVDISIEPPPALEELEKSTMKELALKNDEIKMLRTKLEEKEKEVDVYGQENENLKNKLEEAASKISSGQTKEEEMSLRLSQLGEDLESSKSNAAQLSEQLKSVEAAKEELETEMKKIRVQTEQWRKAADAAAAVLSGGMDMNGRISERCGSMDKHFGGSYEPQAGGFGGFMGSPDLDDGFGSGKRKGSGIKMFGDLWRKKGQK
ncbi:interactor of constitutive active ROPs 4 [Cannabis sativa]|nr:interactor of constitutive active ROPs 4 [Cannabis sativa]XP_030485401.1 interactor of constitutive active ROPs 4 [Cannabis sativa]KAF4393008.1 hypothetical protein G4B88_012003 [Cannabis sativa]